MPTMINGCGTNYAGKANPERHPGRCDACGYTGMLDQYDTRLCVTLFFVPLIPFRRLRIVDACPRCNRHRVVKLRDYEMNRQLAISAALEDWRQSPGVEKAVAAHSVMRTFRQQGHADRFMRELQERFHQDARLKAYHGCMLLEQGRKEEARLQLNEALKLRPDLAEARVPMSRILMDDGNPDGAFKMLEFMLHPGSSQLHHLGPLENLALYLQPNNHHQEALRIFRHLVEELPAIAQVPAFRAAVKRSELVVQPPASILPPKRFSMHDVIFGSKAKVTKWAVFFLVAALLFVARNLWIAHHRTVHVVNAWTEPVSLRLSPDHTVTAPPGHSSFTLAEGSHRIDVSGPVEEVIPLEMHAEFFDRWSKHPAWVLNPGGAAVLMEQHVTMDSRFKSLPPPPKIHAGERVVAVNDVTHLFKDLPDEFHVKRGESVTYSQIAEFKGPLADAVAMLADREPRSALGTAHTALRQDPGDMLVLQAIQPLLNDPTLAGLHRNFLLPYVEARPVNVEWHRAWQGSPLTPNQCLVMQAVYDSLLKKDPQDASLIYLRGRVSPPAEREAWFRRALERDAKHTWAHYGMAWQHHSRGEHQDTLPHLDAALRNRRHDIAMLMMAATCRAALDPARAKQENMLAGHHEARDLSLVRISLAMALLGASGDYEKARFVRENFAGEKDRELDNYLLALTHYAAGNFRGASLAAKTGGSTQQQILYAMLAAGGRPMDAVKYLPRGSESTLAALSVAVAFLLTGDSRSAGSWMDAAVKSLRAGEIDEVLLADLLAKNTAPSLEELNTAAAAPALKALSLAWLTLRYPDKAADYAPQARQLSAVLLPPMQLVRQALAKLPPP